MRAQLGLRLARTKDLDAILLVENACFGGEAYDRKLFADYLHTCGGLFLVAEGRGKIRGYMITCTRGNRAEVISVAVDPAARGRGTASALMDSTLRRLRRRKVSFLRLMVRVTNHPALAFYEKYGFRRMRRIRGYYEDGGDGYAMLRPL